MTVLTVRYQLIVIGRGGELLIRRALVTKYSNVQQRYKTIHPGKPNAYDIAEFNFQTDEAVYQPLLATEETVQAFGMTLLKSGECIFFPSPTRACG
jgi:hypothetical protein